MRIIGITGAIGHGKTTLAEAFLKADIQDPTERERELVEPDSTIINNGTVEDLYVRAATVLTDLRAERLAPEYHAA